MKNENIKEYEPLVSIIVPVYNSSKYLEKCIKSMFLQTYKKIEIIAVNDGSTDNSLEVLNNIKKEDPRLIVINQKNSGGICARRNGVEKARGEYILIEDSDDWLEERLVERCVNEIQKDRDVDVVKFGYIFEPSKKKRNLLLDGAIERKVLEGKDIDQVIYRLLYHSDCNHIWNEMVRKKLYDFNDDIFDHVVHKGEDLQINLQLWQKVKKAVFIEDYLYHYIDNPNGITNSFSPQKTINSVRDNIYLNGIRKKIAIKKYGYVKDDILINKTMSLLSSKILRILALSKKPRDDMLLIQDELENDLKKFLEGFKLANLRQNFLQKRITINMIKGNCLKNMKYRPVCKMLLKMRGKI